MSINLSGLAAAIAERAMRHDSRIGPEMFLDKYRFETAPGLLRQVAAALARPTFDEIPQPDLLAGRELGAVPLVTALALETDVPFVLVRRVAPAGAPAREVEGAFEPGQTVALVEDVLVEGGSALAAVDALRRAGLRVETAVCVIDQGEGAAEALEDAGVRLRPLFDRDAIQLQRA